MRSSLPGMLALLVVAVGLAIANSPARSIPFQFTFTTTASISLIPGMNSGDMVTISVLADNGGTSSLSQSWNESDLLSTTLTGGTYWAIYGAPFLVGIDPAFRTDATGALDRARFDGSLSGQDVFGIGGDILLVDYVVFDYTGNVAILDPGLSDPDALRYWSDPVAAPVPEPGTATLVALALTAGAAGSGTRSIRRRG